MYIDKEQVLAIFARCGVPIHHYDENKAYAAVTQIIAHLQSEQEATHRRQSGELVHRVTEAVVAQLTAAGIGVPIGCSAPPADGYVGAILTTPVVVGHKHVQEFGHSSDGRYMTHLPVGQQGEAHHHVTHAHPVNGAAQHHVSDDWYMTHKSLGEHGPSVAVAVQGTHPDVVPVPPLMTPGLNA